MMGGVGAEESWALSTTWVARPGVFEGRDEYPCELYRSPSSPTPFRKAVRACHLTGKDLAHRRGFEAKKGYSYEHSDLQDLDLHKLSTGTRDTSHDVDSHGRRN